MFLREDVVEAGSCCDPIHCEIESRGRQFMLYFCLPSRRLSSSASVGSRRIFFVLQHRHFHRCCSLAFIVRRDVRCGGNNWGLAIPCGVSDQSFVRIDPIPTYNNSIRFLQSLNTSVARVSPRWHAADVQPPLLMDECLGCCFDDDVCATWDQRLPGGRSLTC